MARRENAIPHPKLILVVDYWFEVQLRLPEKVAEANLVQSPQQSNNQNLQPDETVEREEEQLADVDAYAKESYSPIELHYQVNSADHFTRDMVSRTDGEGLFTFNGIPLQDNSVSSFVLIFLHDEF